MPTRTVYLAAAGAAVVDLNLLEDTLADWSETLASQQDADTDLEYKLILPASRTLTTPGVLRMLEWAASSELPVIAYATPTPGPRGRQVLQDAGEVIECADPITAIADRLVDELVARNELASVLLLWEPGEEPSESAERLGGAAEASEIDVYALSSAGLDVVTFDADEPEETPPTTEDTTEGTTARPEGPADEAQVALPCPEPPDELVIPDLEKILAFCYEHLASEDRARAAALMMPVEYRPLTLAVKNYVSSTAWMSKQIATTTQQILAAQTPAEDAHTESRADGEASTPAVRPGKPRPGRDEIAVIRLADGSYLPSRRGALPKGATREHISRARAVELGIVSAT